MRYRPSGFAILLAGVLAVAGCQKEQARDGGQATGAQIDWKMASAFPSSLPIVGDSGPYFSEKVGRLSRGRISIKFYDPGKLVPALEVFDAVAQGSVDAGWTTAGYWIGKIPAATFFTAVPYGPDTSEYLSWVFEGGGWELWQELYAPHNVMPVPCQITPPEASGWFREPINRLDQFKGLKIRFFGVGGQAIQKLGASVQLLAAADIFPALERGVLDATEFANPSLDERLGFSKIAKHYYFPGWHQQASVGELIINLDRWKALDAIDQEFLVTVCRDVIVRDIAVGEIQQPPALERIKKDGVQVHSWPKEFLDAFRKASQEAIDENAAKDPQFKRVYESYKAFRAAYAPWAKISRVPLIQD